MFYPNSQWLSILRDRTLRTLDRCPGPQKEKRSRPTSTFTGAMWVSGKGTTTLALEKIRNRPDSSRFFQAQIVRGELAFESFRSAIYIFLFPKYIVNEQKFGAPIFWLTSFKSTDLPSFPRETKPTTTSQHVFQSRKTSPNPRSLQSRKCMLSSPALWSASAG